VFVGGDAVWRIEMTHSASIPVLGFEFDDFLFAPIVEDANDMPLSVLSALARLNIDPWQEAAELARLPRETAAQRLASSIAALSDGPTAYLEHGMIAARLIELLPRQVGSEILSRETLLDVGDMTKFRAGMYMCAVLIVFILAAQWIAVDRQTLAQADNTNAPVSIAAFPQMPPPTSGQ
jgi:hypothetical protein